ncbi:MAG: hypothetical protein KDH15_12355, partial [Rhodocyclaceae bacterium]|nr:hypothetical protein [Rhodocyclaceae bacterium]
GAQAVGGEGAGGEHADGGDGEGFGQGGFHGESPCLLGQGLVRRWPCVCVHPIPESHPVRRPVHVNLAKCIVWRDKEHTAGLVELLQGGLGRRR